MYNQVIFYNHFGSGDIFESRDFVKAWMSIVPASSYLYSHGKNPRILLDISELKFMGITTHMEPMRGIWDDNNGNLYVNTWIGRDGRYILPGIGCTVEKLYDMHNDLLSVYNFGKLSGKPEDYIPDIDYTPYKINNINKYIKRYDVERIYIDNGLVQSNQAVNFPFDNIIYRLANNNKDKHFITTQVLPIKLDNLFSINEIANTTGIGFDLNEASYISLFCSTLVGRNSGPHVYSQVKKNCMDDKKKLLSFTYTQQGSSFVVNSNVRIKKYWSSATSDDSIFNKIQEVINE